MRPLEDLLVTTVNFPFPTIENCTLGGHADRDVHAVAHRYNSSSECSPTQVNRRRIRAESGGTGEGARFTFKIPVAEDASFPAGAVPSRYGAHRTRAERAAAPVQRTPTPRISTKSRTPPPRLSDSWRCLNRRRRASPRCRRIARSLPCGVERR